MRRLLSVFCAVFGAVSVAHAGEKEDVSAAFTQWRAAVASADAEKTTALYTPDATLLATLNDAPINTQDARKEYFKKLASKPKLNVSVQSENVRVLDDNNAVVSGLYTFAFEEKKKEKKIPARYTFVYEKIADKWLIVEHHSSKLPSAKH